MRILITGAGGPSAISVWKSLGTSNELHMADMDVCAAGLYLVPHAQRLLVPRGDDPRLISVLLAECEARGIELLLPTVDSELVPVALARAEFAAIGVKLALPSAEALMLCRDKHALLTALATEVPVPESVVLDANTVTSLLTFPRFAKPRASAGSRGTVEVKNAEELEALPKDGSYLLQELLQGAEYSVDVYTRGDGVAIAAVPRERMKIDSGIAITARTVHLPEASDIAIRAARAAGVLYMANVQLKRNSVGELKLLEINPRFPGTLPLTARAGVDIPALMLAEIAGEAMPAELLPFEEVAVARYWTEEYFHPQEMDRLCRP
ncbi:MAG: ATP-grasp domain-containing protein [Acidobacteriaceae bacterium]|nr:ATP-grasp domain-containing protein [Acidobacteriaceae bacterium]